LDFEIVMPSIDDIPSRERFLDEFLNNGVELGMFDRVHIVDVAVDARMHASQVNVAREPLEAFRKGTGRPHGVITVVHRDNDAFPAMRQRFFEIDALVGEDERSPVDKRPQGRVDDVKDLAITARMPVLVLLGDIFQRGNGSYESISEVFRDQVV
jgi:hypothetical protein